MLDREKIVKGLDSFTTKIVSGVFEVGSKLILTVLMFTPVVISLLWIDNGRFPFDIPMIGYSSKNPNLRITFSCHGDRTIKSYNGDGKPLITTEKVSHSITVWRRSGDDLESVKSLSRYRVEKFSIDGDFLHYHR